MEQVKDSDVIAAKQQEQIDYLLKRVEELSKNKAMKEREISPLSAVKKMIRENIADYIPSDRMLISKDGTQLNEYVFEKKLLKIKDVDEDIFAPFKTTIEKRLIEDLTILLRILELNRRSVISAFVETFVDSYRDLIDKYKELSNKSVNL